MKYLFVSFFFLMIFSVSCDKQESSGSGGENRLWPPALSGTRDDSAVELQWMNPVLYEKILRPYDYVMPEKFEIYISENVPDRLKKIVTLENNGQYSFTVSNLKNDINYFFEVKAVRGGMPPIMSDLIMVMPSVPEDIHEVVENKDFPIASGSLSKGNRIMAYVNRNFTWDNGNYGQMSLFGLDITTGENKMIDTSSYFPDWSPTEMKVVYCSDKHEVNTGNKLPQHLVIYDLETGIRKKLTNGKSFDINPEFSNDGKWIVYSSDEGHDGVFNLWKISSDGSQKARITNNLNLVTSSVGNVELGRPVWSSDDNYIYYNVVSGVSVHDGIYRISVQNGKTEYVIKSFWSDMCPAISPDNNRIAFISDRSGTNQIWLYNLSSGAWRQVTGSKGDIINRDWGKIEWSGNNKLLYSGYSQTDSRETVLTIGIN
jgi:hypothetical protein